MHWKILYTLIFISSINVVFYCTYFAFYNHYQTLIIYGDKFHNERIWKDNVSDEDKLILGKLHRANMRYAP